MSTQSDVAATQPALRIGGLLLLVLIGLNLRPFLTSLGPVLDLVRSDTGLDYRAAAILTTLPFVLMGLLAFLGGGLVHRFGEQPVLLGALLVLAAGCGARLEVGSGAGLILTAILTGAGVATVQALMPGVAKRWFSDRIALAMGLYSAALVGGGALGALVSPALAAATSSWRWGLAVWAFPALAAVLLWFWQAPPVPLQEAASARMSVRGFVRNRRAWLLAVYFGLANSGYASLVAWLPSFYRDLGLAAQQSGNLLAWMALFQAAAALLMPLWVRGSSDRRRGLYTVMLLQALGFAGFVLAPLQAPLLWIALAGGGLGGCFSLSLILSLDHLPDSRAAGALTAFVQGLGFLITATGPWLVGALLDGGGDFTSAWGLHGCLAVAMLLVSMRFDPVGYPRAMRVPVA